MSVSVEAYFLTNFCMDFLAIAIVARSLGRVRWRREGIAAALGALYAVIAQLPSLRFLGAVWMLPLISVMLAAIVLRVDSPRAAISGGFAILAGGVFLGGTQFMAMARLFHSRGVGVRAERARRRGGLDGGDGLPAAANGYLGSARVSQRRRRRSALSRAD